MKNRQFHVCGNGKRQSRILLAEFLLNFFASSSRSYLKRIVIHYSLKIPCSINYFFPWRLPFDVWTRSLNSVISSTGLQGCNLQSKAPFTSEIMGSILAVDSWHFCEKSQSTLCRKSWVFFGYSGFLPQGMSTKCSCSPWLDMSPALRKHSTWYVELHPFQLSYNSPQLQARVISHRA
jgi:hypothetical protein